MGLWGERGDAAKLRQQDRHPERIMQSSTDPRPVVVAIDASDSARDAAAWAADLAADWSAPLHLVHVVPGDPQDRPLDPLPSWLTTLLDVAERAGARPCTAEAQPGDLATTIAARAVGARMVVLGSYGAGASEGMLAGTTSRAVVEHAACPVAVVRGSAPRIAPPRGGPVVVGVDGSAAGAAALEFGADLATSLGCQLLAVHCWSDVYATPEGGAHRSRSPETLVATGAAALDEQLKPIIDRHPELDVQRKLVDAPPLQALIEHAAGARMLVVGTRGRTGQTGILMGSTSLSLVDFANCPVVVVHPRRAEATATAAAGETAVRS
jgi:nucleotide-binding universal stress UspA family protein